MEEHIDELAALEALDNGKTFGWAKNVDVTFSISTFKHYAGWADKHFGQVIETDERKLVYSRHEPIGVVGQIIPWNFPRTWSWVPSSLLYANIMIVLMFSWKVAPALATGNSIILKPSEFTPLTAIRMSDLIKEAGFPPGSVNILTGYGNTAGHAISSHMNIDKVCLHHSRPLFNDSIKGLLDRVHGKYPCRA